MKVRKYNTSARADATSDNVQAQKTKSGARSKGSIASRALSMLREIDVAAPKREASIRPSDTHDAQIHVVRRPAEALLETPEDMPAVRLQLIDLITSKSDQARQAVH